MAEDHGAPVPLHHRVGYRQVIPKALKAISTAFLLCAQHQWNSVENGENASRFARYADVFS